MAKFEFKYSILRQIAQLGTSTSSELANRLDTTVFRISKNLRILKEEGLIRKSGRFVTINEIGRAPFLGRFLLDHPGIERVLSDRNFTILQLLETPQSLPSLINSTGIPQRTLYRHIRDLLSPGIVKKDAETYILNTNLWTDLHQLIQIHKSQKAIWKFGLPSTAKIYLEKPEKIIFATESEVAATPTSFSKYTEYGIPILENEKIYRFPKKKLMIKDIFLDSLECLTDIRRKILSTLFYLKHKEELKMIVHPEINHIRSILKGERITGYPTLEEIKERAELYDIRI